MGGPFRAVIFDLDGVLWDGEPLYHEAFNVVLAPLGHRVTAGDYTHIIGLTVEAAWDWVLNRFRIKEPPAPYIDAYDHTVLRLLARPMEPLPGVLPLIAELRRRRVPIAVASASLRSWVDATLRGLALQDTFDATVSASEVDNGKPAPDLFLEAARRLDIPPGRCLAIEDTAAGIAAARAAGMFAVQLRAASTALPPLDEADLVLDSYAQFDLHLLDGAKKACNTEEKAVRPAHPEVSKE
ncbi:MAG: HAD family phosphatase [Chloroflexi bacterium]|nr:HAD family phosphatase [Chloroflexota bacterium]